MNELVKTELSELMKEIPSSSIPLTKEAAVMPKIKIDINNANKEIWGNKSNQLLNDYKYGESLAMFGENNPTTSSFFKRFATSFCAIISNEFQKRGTGAETLKPYYNILESCMNLMAKEIDKKDLKEQDIFSIIAALQGFIINYNQQKEVK